jgi:predicted kinase
VICRQCGAWMQCPAIQALDSVMALAVCASCGYANPIERFPLWFISGSSGSGKTTLAPQLRAWLPDGVVFEGDAIDYWRFQDPDGGYAPLYDQWLKVARELVANRRPVVLLAMATPDQLEASPWRRYFSAIHFLGLVCSETVQAARLRSRPAWRNAAAPEFVQAACAFTRCLEALGQHIPPEIAVADTSTASIGATVDQVLAWVRCML